VRGRPIPVRPAPPRPDCRICGGSGEDAHGQRCVCTYNKDRAALSLPASAGEERPATAELRERVARAICKTDRFDTGEGTCAALCMEQLGDPRRKGCGHALRVHGTLVDAILAALPELAGGSEWRPIETYTACRPVLVGRRADKYLYGPLEAFMDVTGVWRVLGSEGGMTPVPFEPDVWMPLPAPPEANGGGDDGNA
jgi:hypothetical protein